VNPRLGARVLAGGRVGLGIGLLVAPRGLARAWVGRHAERPSVQALVRAIGARDAVIGMIALHTLDHPEVGPRWQRTAAALDAIDAAVTVAAARDLSAANVAGTVVLAGGAAVAGLTFARSLNGD
jgi:hypothetical protein